MASKTGMFMAYTTIIGLIAATLTVVAFFPQLMKVWKTKSTKDISLGMFSLFCVGVFSWFVYGILIEDASIIVANLLVFAQALIIVILKVKYR